MTKRTTLLRNLAVGDIFHASCPNGASLICLVESVAEIIIKARTMTHQIKLEFDRRTGVASRREDEVPCTIDSIAPLPVEIHNVMLGLDRKMRLEPDIMKHKLIENEQKALIFIASYYPANPIRESPN